MNIVRIILFLLPLMFSIAAQGGEPLADLALSVSVAPDSSIPPGTEGTITLSITNLGPITASGIFGWDPTDIGGEFSDPPLEFPPPAMGTCEISPVIQPRPGDLFAIWQIRDLFPGEARECIFNYQVLQATRISQLARWNIQVPGNVNDPDESNNVAEVLLIFADPAAARSVPLLSPLGLLLLILLIAVGIVLHPRSHGEH